MKWIFLPNRIYSRTFIFFISNYVYYQKVDDNISTQFIKQTLGPLQRRRKFILKKQKKLYLSSNKRIFLEKHNIINFTFWDDETQGLFESFFHFYKCCIRNKMALFSFYSSKSIDLCSNIHEKYFNIKNLVIIGPAE